MENKIKGPGTSGEHFLNPGATRGDSPLLGARTIKSILFSITDLIIVSTISKNGLNEILSYSCRFTMNVIFDVDQKLINPF
jgi:hypothetical protein